MRQLNPGRRKRHSAASAADPGTILAKAFLNAGKALGMTQDRLSRIVGRHRSALHKDGLDPDSKAGELALLFIRIYRSLHVLVGGDSADMKHWMHTDNHHTGGVPSEQIMTITGLVHVLEYLDAMRGRV